MTEKGCVEWMKTKQVSELDTQTYYECCQLPQLGLNTNISRYGARPVRNSPESMPWDTSLNRYAHKTVRRHCVMSRATLKRQGKSSRDDVRHFSMSTPELAAQTYKRLLHPITGVAPSSKRILEDVSGVWLAMKIVYEKRVCTYRGWPSGVVAVLSRAPNKKRAVEAHARRVFILLPTRNER